MQKNVLMESETTSRKVLSGNKSTRTLIFGRVVVHKERIDQRGPYFFVEWLSANKRNKSMRTLAFA